MAGDRVGIGWRDELAVSILSHTDEIDLVEVILDDYLDAPAGKLRALRTLAAQVPTVYHGVGLGLASAFPVEGRRIDRLARVIDQLAPESWSEHLAFVRAGGMEIGHLAAPPRVGATVQGALENLARIERAVGSAPALENIATLVDPPGSTLGEQAWTSEILAGSGCAMLLDLHNLYANAMNFGFDPAAYLLAFPLDKVAFVHLSGGRWIDEPAGLASRPDGAQGTDGAHDAPGTHGRQGRRILDDHVHDVPGEVFGLLELLAGRAPRDLTVILERDGEYPDFQVLLGQLSQAREALARGRGKRAAPALTGPERMSA